MRPTLLTRSWLTLLLLAFVAAASACGGTAVEQDDTRPESERNAEPAPLNSKVYVTAQELQQFANEGATIIDARALEDYEAGHFPGAVHTDGGKAWKDDNGFLITDVVEAQQKVRDLGIDRDRKVVIYADARDSGAGRLFWTLEYFGHGEVYLYPNDYSALKGELAFEEQTDAPSIEEGDFVVAYRDSVLATRDEVEQAVDGDLEAILIDTRREGEFNGTENRGDPRQGYIPGAVWYYYENVWDENNELRSKEALRTEFDEVGLLQENAVLLPYCQTGTRSATIYAVLRWLGVDNAQNYDGSWVEWSDSELPIEQPQNQ